MGFDTILPLFVKAAFGWDSTAAGLIFLCLFVPGFASPLVGRLSDRYGARYLALGGMAAAVPLLVCLRFVSPQSSSSPLEQQQEEDANRMMTDKVVFGVLLTLIGITLVFANMPL